MKLGRPWWWRPSPGASGSRTCCSTLTPPSCLAVVDELRLAGCLASSRGGGVTGGACRACRSGACSPPSSTAGAMRDATHPNPIVAANNSIRMRHAPAIVGHPWAAAPHPRHAPAPHLRHAPAIVMGSSARESIYACTRRLIQYNAITPDCRFDTSRAECWPFRKIYSITCCAVS